MDGTRRDCPAQGTGRPLFPGDRLFVDRGPAFKADEGKKKNAAAVLPR